MSYEVNLLLCTVRYKIKFAQYQCAKQYFLSFKLISLLASCALVCVEAEKSHSR